MKVIIAGGRYFNNEELLCQFCDGVLQNLHTIEIVSGGAKGADFLGEKYAKKRNYKLKRFPAAWSKYGKGAGPKRNTAMAIYADLLIAFWDGRSRGTKSMINLAKKKGLIVHTCFYEIE